MMSRLPALWRRQPPEAMAALTNGALVLLLPVGLAVAGSIGLVLDDRSVTPPGSAFRQAVVDLLFTAAGVIAISPLAVLAAWRTWVHARRYRCAEASGWQGAFEAAALGFMLALTALMWGLINRPAEALPYVVFYGGAGALMGFVLGAILRTTGLFVLTRTGQVG